MIAVINSAGVTSNAGFRTPPQVHNGLPDKSPGSRSSIGILLPVDNSKSIVDRGCKEYCEIWQPVLDCVHFISRISIGGNAVSTTTTASIRPRWSNEQPCIGNYGD